jgi:AmiR/NasT family two-component response regulator
MTTTAGARHAPDEIGVAELKRRIANLQIAVVHRDVIGPAKGILMAVRGVRCEAAFAMLVRESQTSKLKLYEVARQLVDETVRG